MTQSKFISIKTVFSDILDTVDENIISMSDVIEWASKAMGQMDLYESHENAIAIKKVEDFQTWLPKGTLQVNQIAYKLDFKFDNNDVEYYSRFTDQVYKDFSDKYLMKYDYFNRFWAPLKVATSSFILTVLCENSPNLVTNCEHEYTILPSGKIVTSFKEGYIIISYMRAPMDEEGYFLIPNDDELVEALRFYVLTRSWEKRWNRKEDGAGEKFQYYSMKWGIYKNMIKGKFKLPTSDQYQNIIEYSTSLLPKTKRYYNYFGTLGSPDKTFY